MCPTSLRHNTVASLPLIALVLAACSAGTTPPGEYVRSDHARITAPGVSAADLASFARSNTDFAAGLHRAAAASDDGNRVFSPWSVSVALAMTRAGAAGTTASQMDGALHFGLPAAQLHAAFNSVDLALARRASTAAEHGGQPFRLAVTNAVFSQRGEVLLPTYLDTLAENYGAGVSLLDFAADPEGARRDINRWVADRTEQRIPELLGQGAITSITRLVLTNAVYFRASWDNPFDPARTTTDVFHRASGGDVSVPTMHQVSELNYAEGAGWQAVELPYVGNEVSMLVLLPPAGTMPALEASLSAERLDAIVAALSNYRVTLALPRFSMRWNHSLKGYLQGFGMRDAFEGGVADFSGIDGTRTLFIQDVVHEGFCAVNEAGTEAAAATAVIIGRVSLPPTATFTADRPFLFVIRDRPTGTVLFVGRVSDPSAG